ncbi:MAG TPA: hypothetical protein VMU54_02505, partial [Planctomycetota bacterium]|nr:hypothetical protein [Planctomycetota bacterium]
RSRSFIEGVIADRIRSSLERLFERTMRRVVAGVISSMLFGTAAVFVLIAGLEGLKQAGAPVWAAYLCLGLVGALGGALLIRTPTEPRDR